MNQKDLISIIIPVYNVKDYIDECLNSVINQTYKNLEIILIDDGSTDGSGNICDDYEKRDNRIRVIHKENGGLSDARNIGMETAMGGYYGFVDADDYIEHDMYEILLNLCKQYNVGVSAARYDQFGEGIERNPPEPTGEKEIISGENFLINILTSSKIKYSTYSVWDRLYKREILSNLSFPKNRCYEDIVFTTVMALRAGKIAYINKALYHYRLRDGSISYKKDKKSYDKKLITDRLPNQKEQIDYLRSKGYGDLANLAMVKYREEISYIAEINTYHEFDDVINKTIDEWRINISSILKLPISSIDKVKIMIKRLFPHIINRLLYISL